MAQGVLKGWIMDDCHEHECIWMDTAYGAWLGAQGGKIGTALIGYVDVWK